jgi:hypothetical protein
VSLEPSAIGKLERFTTPQVSARRWIFTVESERLLIVKDFPERVLGPGFISQFLCADA